MDTKSETSNKNLQQAKAIVLATRIDQGPASKEVLTADQLVKLQEQRLMAYRGRELIGLAQKTLPTLDDLLSGIRKFILLAAAPNVGKTALSIQLAMDILKNNEKTCVVFVSLEMSREDIIDRMRCYLTPITFKKLYFGSKKPDGDKGWYTDKELQELKASKEILESIGSKICILDEECCKISADSILENLKKIKHETKSIHAVVIIDYLQVFPIPEGELQKSRSDNELDRHRINQMKILRNYLHNDPLIVIAEARKPSGTEKWASSIADILGSSRIAYACDAGLLINTVKDEELKANIPQSADEQIKELRNELTKQGIALVNLTIDKGRDGMQKGQILLIHRFQENRFEETTWKKISETIKQDKVSCTNNKPIEDDKTYNSRPSARSSGQRAVDRYIDSTLR